MSLTTAIAELRSADASCVALEPQFLAGLIAAQGDGDQVAIARYQARVNVLRAIREAIGQCIDRAIQVT